MLEIGKPNEVKFKVDVNGTSAVPSVRFVIETPEAELGFNCNRGDGYWFTSVTLPDDLQAGDYPFRVEVVVNNKLFTPVKKTVTCARATEIAAEEATQAPATPTQTPDQTREWENEGGALKGIPEIPKPIPPEKTPEAPSIPAPIPAPPVKRAPIGNLMKEVSTDKKSPPRIKNLQPEPAKIDRPVKTVKTPLPKPLKEKPQPIRIKIAEIVADSNARFDTVLKQSPSYRKPGKAVIPINVNIGVPISLQREEVVYE